MPARAALVLSVLVSLAILHTWPISRAPARASLNHNADAQLCASTMSWIAHTLPRDPMRLFDAPIFWPEPQTLTYTDPMLPPALLGAPVRWLGGSPVLTFNLVMLAGLVLTAAGAALVVWRWTGSVAGAVVGGVLTAFNVHLLTRLPHIVATHAWGLPLVFYLADRLATKPSRRDTVWLALTVAAIAATSPYLLALAAVIIGVVLIGSAIGRDRHGSSPLLIAAGAALGVVIALPVLAPYFRFAATGARRPLEIVEQFSASPAGYLASTSLVHRGWTAGFYTNDVNTFFPGIAALVFAGAGLAMFSTAGANRRRSVMLVAIGVIGMLLSFGPATFFYRWLYEWLPPLQGLRAAARFGYLFLLAIALLASLGVAQLSSRLKSRAGRVALAAAAVAAVTMESWHGPARTLDFPGVPAVYSVLAESAERVVLVETPFFPPEAAFEHGEYVLNATAHWRPLMNGYSGFLPASFRRRAESFWLFPRSEAIEAMKRDGATHVMVHLERFGAEAAAVADALIARDDVQLLASDNLGHRLYRFREP